MPTLQGYEVIDQTAFRIESTRNRHSLLGADYGAGYADFVSVAPTVKHFVAMAGVWPDNSFFGTIATKTWMDYYWDFLTARLENGNEPFVISWFGSYWLVQIEDPETSVENLRCENSDLFVPAKISLKQRRVSGVTENANGSLTGSVVP